MKLFPICFRFYMLENWIYDLLLSLEVCFDCKLQNHELQRNTLLHFAQICTYFTIMWIWSWYKSLLVKYSLVSQVFISSGQIVSNCQIAFQCHLRPSFATGCLVPQFYCQTQSFTFCRELILAILPTYNPTFNLPFRRPVGLLLFLIKLYMLTCKCVLPLKTKTPVMANVWL